MKKAFALIHSITMLLILTACGKTVDNNISQNEPSESNAYFKSIRRRILKAQQTIHVMNVNKMRTAKKA